MAVKIDLVSDLHLEFADLTIEDRNGADVLVLSGDILLARPLYDFPSDEVNPEWVKNISDRYLMAKRFRRFLRECSEQYQQVLFVAGNHEFYTGNWEQTLDILRKECDCFPNVKFMENDTITFGDVTFIGGTLWTDMNKSDSLTIRYIADALNDYRTIRVESRNYAKLRPFDTIERHYSMLRYIESVVEGKQDQKFVVVGHHAPSKLSTHPSYAHDLHMNGGYSSDLSEFILDHPQIKLWTHGHTHHNFDYVIGETRVVANPRGYVGYERGSQEEDPYYPQLIEV
jgi:Icc-related predicted phosphoesterase